MSAVMDAVLPVGTKPIDYVHHMFPILRWLPVYKWRLHALPDAIAGACLAMLAAPEALSYAMIAGLQPQYGLYTAFMAPLAYALVCTSPHLVTGPTTIMSILTQQAHLTSWAGATLSPTDYARVCATLALLCALLQMLLSALRAGVLTRLISPAVVLGFTSGSAFIIASTQFSTVLGVPKCVGDGGGSCTFAAAVSNAIDHGSSIQAGVPVASLLCIVILLAVKYGLPRLLPASIHVLSHTGPLVLLLIVTPIMYVYEKTLASHGISAVGSIPAGMPLPALPIPPSGATSADIAALFAGAIPCVLVGYMESLSIARTLARQYGPYSIDESQELFAIGFSNLAVSLLQGYPITGSFSRSAVNAGSGARSPLSSVIASVLLALALLLLTPALQYMPKVALAAIILVVILRLIEPGLARAMYSTSRSDFYIALTVFTITIFSNVTYGLYVGFAGSWILSLVRSYDARATVTLYAWTTRDSSGRVDGGAGAIPETAPVWTTVSSLTPQRAGLAHVLVNAESPVALSAVASTNGPDAGWSRVSTVARQPVAVVLRIGPEHTFAHVDRLTLQVHEARQCYAPRVIILDASAWTAMDFAGASGVNHLAVDVAHEAASLPTCRLVLAGARGDMLDQMAAAAAADVKHAVTHAHVHDEGATPLLHDEVVVSQAQKATGSGVRSFATLAEALTFASRECSDAVTSSHAAAGESETGTNEDAAAMIPESTLTVATRLRRQATEPLMPAYESVPNAAAHVPQPSPTILQAFIDGVRAVIVNALADARLVYSIASSSSAVLTLDANR